MTSLRTDPSFSFAFRDEFDEVVAALSTLKAAACKARDEVIPRKDDQRVRFFPWK